MARPAGSPIGFATTGGATRTTISAGLQADGFVAKQKPGYKQANTLWGIAYDWLQYLATQITGSRFKYDTAQTLILNTSAMGFVVNDDSTSALTSALGTPPYVGYSAAAGTAHLWHEVNPQQFDSGTGNYTFTEFYGTTKSSNAGVTSVSYTFMKYKADGTSAATPIATVTNDGTSTTGWVQDSPTSLGAEAFDPAYIYGIRVIIVGNAVGDALLAGVVVKMTAPGPV